MGGAFGALGGEISSISLNPAGSAIFNQPDYAKVISQMRENLA